MQMNMYFERLVLPAKNETPNPVTTTSAPGITQAQWEDGYRPVGRKRFVPDFGNMTTEASSNRPFANSPGASACQVASGATLLSNNWAAFASSSGNNQVTAAALMSGGPLGYDAAGNVQQDNLNKYAYDAEGRICAVENLYSGAVTQYIYNADGTRVAKGAYSCEVDQGC